MRRGHSELEQVEMRWLGMPGLQSGHRREDATETTDTDGSYEAWGLPELSQPSRLPSPLTRRGPEGRATVVLRRVNVPVGQCQSQRQLEHPLEGDRPGIVLPQ